MSLLITDEVGMKATGIGAAPIAPAHWVACKLKHHLSNLGSGGTPDTNDNSNWSDSDDGVPWVAISDMSDIDEIFETSKHITSKGLDEKRLTVWPVGTLLFSMYASLGHVAELKISAATNQAILALAFDRQLIQSFGKWWLKFLQPSLVSDANSNTQDNLNAEKVRNLPLLLPPIFEQNRIVAYLDRETARIDALVEKKTRFIELLREKRQALITHAVTKGLDPHVKMKDSGVEWLGEVPENWEVKSLKWFTKVGNGSTPSRDNPDYWNEGNYPWLNSSFVNKEEIFSAEEFVTEVALNNCHLPIVTPPAVLIGLTGQGKTRGLASTLRIEATINQHVAFVKTIKEDATVDYLRRVIDAAYNQLRDDSDGGGSTKGAVTCEQINNLKVPLPPINEQGEIVIFLKEKLNHFDSLVDKTERSIEFLKERRSAIITAAVTGQIDLREAV